MKRLSLFTNTNGCMKIKKNGEVLGAICQVHDKSVKVDPGHCCFAGLMGNKWLGFPLSDPLNWPSAGVCFIELPLVQIVVIGTYGEAYFCGGGDEHIENIADHHPVSDRGHLRHVRNIGGKAHVCGMDRQVYRRDGVNTWVCIDQGCRPKPDEIVSFESIDGFSEQDIYTAGSGGEIWNFDGATWRQIDSPTNIILTNLVCAGDGQVYLCGRLGMLIVGRNDTWRVIDHGVTEDDFWDIAWFKGRLYLSTLRMVYVLDGDALIPVDWGDDAPATCCHLSACDDAMWSIGPKDIMSFDGEEWSRIE